MPIMTLAMEHGRLFAPCLLDVSQPRARQLRDRGLQVPRIVPFQSHFHQIGSLPMLTCALADQGVLALLGTDVLSLFHIFLNGPHGFFSVGV
ncbi:hypothetical protein HZA57_02625 [Candidatus Poribacteria bacterium]|nr:hypothetical protein [Candidatus Poribacteria bacterium]